MISVNNTIRFLPGLSPQPNERYAAVFDRIVDRPDGVVEFVFRIGNGGEVVRRIPGRSILRTGPHTGFVLRLRNQDGPIGDEVDFSAEIGTEYLIDTELNNGGEVVVAKAVRYRKP